VQESAYESTHRGCEDGEPALRLGMRMVKSLTEAAGKRVEAARSSSASKASRIFARRAVLDRGISRHWPRPGRFRPERQSPSRLLGMAGTERSLPLAPQGERRRSLRKGRPIASEAPTKGNASSRLCLCCLTLGRHPMALLRDKLARNVATARISAVLRWQEGANRRHRPHAPTFPERQWSYNSDARGRERASPT